MSVESGTHRLVRISPFDNQGRRQTSFAAVEVVPVLEQTDEIEIPDEDVRVDVFRSSGPGGQSVNTTDSAVRLTHIPTGTVVSCQNEKSQLQNKASAMVILKAKLLVMKKAEEAAELKDLKGDVMATWGDQMRNYVLNPYQMVKDLRTGYEVGNPQAVFDGDIDAFIEAGIRWAPRRRARRRELAPRERGAGDGPVEGPTPARRAPPHKEPPEHASEPCVRSVSGPTQHPRSLRNPLWRRSSEVGGLSVVGAWIGT